MDPEETLRTVENNYIHGGYDEVADSIDSVVAYLDWRNRNGFEPKDGDRRVVDALRNLADQVRDLVHESITPRPISGPGKP
jgi:hypothetical protein